MEETRRETRSGLKVTINTRLKKAKEMRRMEEQMND